MDEPWYESHGPDMAYVKNDIHRNIDTYSSRFPLISREFMKKIFDEVIQKEYGQYTGYTIGPSFRGYATFTRRNIIDGIEDKLREKSGEFDKAYNKLKNNIILNTWIIYILYRPLTEHHKEGLRYNVVKMEFESHVQSLK